MHSPIEAILFDMGGTLRKTIRRRRDEKRQLIARILELAGMDMAAGAFARLLARRAEAYKHWAEESLVELNEADLWTKWMLPEKPAGQIRKIAVQLNQLYRQATGIRVLYPDSREVVVDLYRRGYRLGLVSNTTSSVEAPELLKELGISGCFSVVVLSAVVGKRKPDPAILLEAAHRMGVSPEYCAYVGDRPERDVIAARKAGFARSIILHNPRKPLSPGGGDPSLTPDQSIGRLKELLNIFPSRQPPRPLVTYNASLSTMWAIKTFPTLVDFFEFTQRSGFASIELNHKITSAMLEGIDLSRYRFSSVHEPCPADIAADVLKKQDWLVSALDEDRRQRGVDAMRRSIDLAHRLGAGKVILHIGHASADLEPERKLRALLETGQGASDEYRRIQAEMRAARAAAAGAAFEAVQKSLVELLDHARLLGVQLGVENRYHYTEFPLPDEFEQLLSLKGSENLGLIYDAGHGQALAKMGFIQPGEWLRRFASRIIGTHLHDVIGTTDHYAPGMGEIDFDYLAACLPEKAFRTCEFQTVNSAEQVLGGLRHLVEHGCIQPL